MVLHHAQPTRRRLPPPCPAAYAPLLAGLATIFRIWQGFFEFVPFTIYDVSTPSQGFSSVQLQLLDMSILNKRKVRDFFACYCARLCVCSCVLVRVTMVERCMYVDDFERCLYRIHVCVYHALCGSLAPSLQAVIHTSVRKKLNPSFKICIPTSGICFGPMLLP